MHDLPFCQQADGIYAQELKVKVVSCQAVENKADSKRSKKKEGGGQPYDHGFLGDDVQVTNVQRQDGKIIHTTNKPVEEGSEVTVKIDWTRRFDHMQQHSGQHLVSAVLEKQLGAYTTSWWMAEYPQDCYVDFDYDEFTSEEIQNAENEMNRLIRANTNHKLSILSDMESLLAHDFFKAHPHKVPSELKEPMRLMEIEGVECNPCCGTHVRNLSELQMIKLLKSTTNKGKARLSFLCGERLSAYASSGFAIDKGLTQAMNVGRSSFVEIGSKLANDNTLLRRTQRKMQEEISDLLSNQLISQSTDSKVITLYREGASMETIDGIGQHLATKVPDKLAFLAARPSLSEKSGVFLLVGPPELVAVKGKEVATQLNGRGGGRAGRFQGKCTSMTQKDFDNVVSLLTSAQ